MIALERFIQAQENSYDTALSEIKNGRKKSHWMWFIFPQLKGLGFSTTAQHYGIENIEEAAAYFQHLVLGQRLIEICKALMQLPTNDAHAIFGSPDDLKLRSCVSLFAAVPNTDGVFQQVLDKFFSGVPDSKTMQLLSKK